MTSGLTATIPHTLLQAVNTMLEAIGQAQVTSLGLSDMTEDAKRALQTLSDMNVEVQSQGWHFNTEEEFPLVPSSPDGFIVAPANATSIAVHQRSFPIDGAWRDGKLYDKGRRSYVFDKTVYVNLTLLFEFETLPQALRWYVTCRAGRQFGTGRHPDATTYRFGTAAEDDARARWEQADQEERNTTLPATSHHFARHRRGQRYGF